MKSVALAFQEEVGTLIGNRGVKQLTDFWKSTQAVYQRSHFSPIPLNP